ncbi:hypothetical protein FRC01_010554, partial [Tulasnella sp. 417]
PVHARRQLSPTNRHPVLQIAMSTQHSAELPDHPIPPSTAHILRLPEEIFVAVIVLYLDANDVNYRKHINNLRRVCQSWNKVIRHTPRFWVTIKDTDGQNWTRLALKLSESQPLDIRYETFGDLGCFPLLLPHIHRFESLCLRFPADSSCLPEEIRTNPAPRLTRLTLSGWHEGNMADRPDETVTLFAGKDYETDFIKLLQNLPKSWIGGAELKSTGGDRPRVHLDYRRFHLQFKGFLDFGKGHTVSFLLEARSFSPVRFLQDIVPLWGGALNGEGGVDVGLNFGRTHEAIIKSRLDTICSTLSGTKRLFVNYGYLFPAVPVDFYTSVLLGPLSKPLSLAEDGDGESYSRTWRLPRLYTIIVRYSDQVAPELLEFVRTRMMSPDPTAAPAARLKLVILGDQTNFTPDIHELKNTCEDVEFMSEDDCPVADLEFIT